MASKTVARPWYEDDPDLVKEIRQDLQEHYPTLRLDIQDGQAEVRGTFPILDKDGTEFDRWEVSIVLPHGYPRDLPVVRETGRRIPANLDNHVLESDGTACVLLPETRYKWFPHGAPFREYLDGPLRAFFANQSYRARGGEWVHGEWEHGPIAAVQFYKEILGSTEDIVGWRGIIAMALGLRNDQLCPCGRRRPVQRCHPILLEVRDNMGSGIAERRLMEAFQIKFNIRGVDRVVAFIRALRGDVKGHHRCPCGSGARVRDCHAGLRELNGAVPEAFRPKGSRRQQKK